MTPTRLICATLLVPALMLGGCSSSDDTNGTDGTVIPQNDAAGSGSGLAPGDDDGSQGSGTSGDDVTGSDDGGGDLPAPDDGTGTGTDGLDTSGTDTGSGGLGSDGDPTPNDDPVQQPRSDLDILVDTLQETASLPLEALNRQLHGGETLGTEEQACLGSYDAASGEPLTAIDCPNGLVFYDAVRIRSASLSATEACRAGLLVDNASDCPLLSGDLSILTQWVIPDVPQDGGYVPARPQPIAGIDIHYRTDGDTLVLENTTGALTGVFRCQIDLATSSAIDTALPGDCPSLIVDTTERLRAILDAPTT